MGLTLYGRPRILITASAPGGLPMPPPPMTPVRGEAQACGHQGSRVAGLPGTLSASLLAWGWSPAWHTLRRLAIGVRHRVWHGEGTEAVGHRRAHAAAHAAHAAADAGRHVVGLAWLGLGLG